MKKKRIAGLLLLCPLTLLTACGGGTPSLALSANWSQNPLAQSVDGTHETLEYSVTFRDPEGLDYYAHYEEGTFTTELSTRLYSFGNGDVKSVYEYHTRLDIGGYYVYNGGQGERFDDFVDTTVCFRSVSDGFLPLESRSEIHSSNPVGNPSEEMTFSESHFTYEIKYSTAASDGAPLETATVQSVYTLSAGDNEQTEEKEPEEVELDYDGSFLDMGQVLFALRGLELNAVVSFGVLEPQPDIFVNDTMTFLDTPAATTVTLNGLEVNGAVQGEEENGVYTVQIEALNVHLAFEGNHPGPTRSLYYAKKDASNNLYRNVMLRCEDPLAGNLGTLVYTLKSAEFSEK